MPDRRPRRRHWAPLLSLLLLGGVWTEWNLLHLTVGDAEGYHARVAEAAALLPYRIGEWEGTDVETPPAALALLRPNVLVGRRYENASTGEDATLVVVQCRDARDMGGHYPPRCYPAHGWAERGEEPREIRVEGLVVPTTEYRFTVESVERYEDIVIQGFFVRPDGSLESGHGGVRKAAADPRLRGLGAAQVQVRFDAAMAPERRDEIFRTLVAGALPVIEAIRQGVAK